MFLQVSLCSSEQLRDDEQRDWLENLTEDDYDKFVCIVDGDDSEQRELGGLDLFSAEELLEDIRSGEERGSPLSFIAVDSSTDRDEAVIRQFEALMAPGDEKRRGSFGGVVFHFL